MAENRFFILEDEEYDDVEPCIRDRTFKIKDIYGHYRYDDLEEICNELNRLNNENKRLVKMLDNVANYMQKQNKNIPIDDFVEWWNNITTEGFMND